MWGRSLRCIVGKSVTRSLNGANAVRFGARHYAGKSQPTSSNKEPIYLYGRSEQDIVKSLKMLKFNGDSDKDSILATKEWCVRYLQSLNILRFKRSTTHLNKLKDTFKKNRDLKDSVQVFQMLIVYLIEESQLEIKRLTQFPSVESLLESRMTALQEQPNDNDDLESFVFENMIDSDILTDEFCHLNHTKALFHILNELRVNKQIDWQKYISIDQLVMIFESSKLININDWKQQGIFLSASFLYSEGLGIRMDPVNESFYVNSLTYFKYFKKAFDLVQSNLDNVNQRWWWELSLTLSLINNNLKNFQLATIQMDTVYPDYQGYTSPKILKLAIRKYSKVVSSPSSFGDKNSPLDLLLHRFITMIEKYGIKPEQEDNQNASIVNFQSEKEADEYLNRKELISYSDILSVTNSLLYNNHFSLADSFLKKLVLLREVSPEAKEITLITKKLEIIKDFDNLKVELTNNRHHLPRKERLFEFKILLDRIITKYLDQTNHTTQILLFDQLSSLVSNFRIQMNIGEIISKYVDNQTILKNHSHLLLKSFVSFDQLDEANDLITKLENSQRLEKSSSCDKSLEYPPIDTNHYATMIKYYTNKAKNYHSRDPGSNWKNMEVEIIKIMDKVQSLKIPFTSTFISRLIIFYRESKNFERCFQIIQETLSIAHSAEEDTHVDIINPTSLIRQNLYYEIWKTYYQYYKIQNFDILKLNEQRNKTNWNHLITQTKIDQSIIPTIDLINLFHNMIERDNLLPDVDFIKLILDTFIKSRNWVPIPAIITQCTQVFDLQFDDNIISDLMVGIQREFISQETTNLLQKNHDLTFTAANLEAKKEAELLFSNKDIAQLGNHEEKIKQLLTNVIILNKFKNPYDTVMIENQKAYELLNIMDKYPKEIIESCK